MENLMKKAKLFCDFFFKENVIERKKILYCWFESYFRKETFWQNGRFTMCF